MMAFAGRSLLALRRTTQLQVLRNRKCISIRNKSGTAETDPLMMRRKASGPALEDTVLAPDFWFS
jgi:hypothetical protein